jgi:hypothetical protein
VRMCSDGDHDGLVERGYLFIFLRPAEPVLRTRGTSRAAMSQMVGARAQVPRGGLRAAPGQEAEAGATGHVAAPELSRAGRWEREPLGHVAALELPPAGRREPLP